MKPNRAFYEKALAQFGVTPDTCLFIDDRTENIARAEAFGIRAIPRAQPDETITAVRIILGQRG